MAPTHLSQGWPAPAKLNLFLHILGRRADGYHLLQTLFQFLDFGDELSFSVREGGEVRLAAELPGVPAERDLTVRAARLLKEATGTPLGVEITVDKRLPMGGGIGGGSSDAATTLVALNRLWGCGLDEDALAALGLRLGADVPVFVRGRAAWAEGVGERLEAVELPEPWFLVVVPDACVATAEIFQAPELTRDSAPIKIRDFLAGQGGNDCEKTVCSRYPQVREALEWLGDFGPARLTGTGACVFAPLPDEPTARAVAARLPDRWRGFVARGRNRSPLHDRLERPDAP